MTSLEQVLRKELHSTVLLMSGFLFILLSLVISAFMVINARDEVRLIENFAIESTKNALVYEDPILLQRAASNFWQAISRDATLLAGFDIYIDGEWVAQGGKRSAFSTQVTRNVQVLNGKHIQLKIELSIVPFLLRIAVTCLLVLGSAFLIYRTRWKKAAARLAKLTTPIDKEVEQLFELAHGRLLNDRPMSGEASQQIREIARLSEAYIVLFRKMEALNDLQLRQQITEAQKLLAAQVAHDIRSPLSFLNIVFNIPEKLNENAEAAKKAISRLNEIAESLLQRFREPEQIANGRLSKFNIQTCVQDILLEKAAQLAGIQTECLFEGDQFVLGDAVEFRRLVSNILNNSIEALSSEGKIRISGIACNDGTLEIQFIDNGRGMSPDVLAKAGQLGFSSGKVGTGLGIYSARKAVEHWGGKLEITSQVGTGTEVTITLRTH